MNLKKKKKRRALKLIKAEEEKQKQLEYIKIKEWEEKFDREQKAESMRKLRKRLQEKELEKLKS